jgi:MFS family permease
MSKISRIIVAGVLFWAHLALLTYTNAAYLSQFFSSQAISAIFGISSLCSIAFVLYLPNLIKRVGSLKLILALMLIDSAFLFSIALASHFAVLATLFIFYLASTILVTALFDLLIEHYSPVARTGRIRGAYLVLLNTTIAIGPGIASIVSTKGLSMIYLFALAFVGLAIFCVAGLIGQIHPKKTYQIPSWHKTLRGVLENKILCGIFFSEFSLQFFYSVMTIYLTQYLIHDFGLKFEIIGIVLVIMLLPFIFLQYPLGILCDKLHLELGLMRNGFLVMALGTALLTVSPVGSVAFLAVSLFISRIGAASVEVATESAFFKQIHEQDSGTLSFFRAMVPLAGFTGSAFGFLMLPFGFWNIFIMLALSMVLVSLLIQK